NVIRKSSVVYQIAVIFKARYLVTDAFSCIRYNFMNNFPDGLHPPQRFTAECLMIFIDGLIIRLSHTVGFWGYTDKKRQEYPALRVAAAYIQCFDLHMHD